jgi:hypothetical protein
MIDSAGPRMVRWGRATAALVPAGEGLSEFHGDQCDRRLGCTDGVFKCPNPAQARRKVAAIKERLQTLRAQHRIDVRRVAPVRTRVAHKYVVSLFATVITADQICVNNSSPSQLPYGSSRFAAS